MKSQVCLLLLMMLAAPLAFGDHPMEADIVIRGGQVFDTQAKAFKANEGIAVKDGKFVALGKDASKTNGKSTIQLDDDQFILPGIVDCHAHYNVRLVRKRREEFEVMPIVYLANGVTVTFSCGEFAPERMRQLRLDIDAGKQIGPRLINSGPYFGRARPGWRGIKPADEIKQEVDFWVKQGVGAFKAKAISPPELKPLIEQAHHHGLTVTGHLDSGYRNSVNPRDAIEMGIDRIEHFLGGDAMPDSRSAYSSLAKINSDMPEFKKIVQIYLDNETWFDATITAYGYFGSRGEEYDMWFPENEIFTPYVQERMKTVERRPMRVFEEIYHAKQKTIDDFHRAGGRISLGTDHFSDGTYLPGFGAHRELDAFVRSGIPAEEAILIATINGARALGIDRDHGSIEVGKAADLFVVSGDPIQNIRNTRKVEQVMSRGKIYRAAKLLEDVMGKLGPNDEDESEDW